MHSSRMRTARLLPVSPSMHCSGGGVFLVSSWGVFLVSSWGEGGVFREGVSARGVLPQCILGYTPPREQNHRHV